MNKHKNILESLLKGSQEDTEVKSLLINNMLLLDIMFKKYPELKSVAVDLFCSYEVPRKTDEYEQNLEKLRPADSDLVYRVKLPRKDKPVVKIEKLNLLNDSALLWGKKINELVDMVNNIISVQEKMIDSRFVVNAVNELKGGEE